IDTFDGGTAPLEVLEDVEHAVVLSIQGRTLSGNLSHLNASVTLSRLRWQRVIPNVVQAPTSAETGTWPVAFPAGVQVALTVGPGSRWVPGFFARDDGTYTPFPSAALDGGFVFRGFDGQGNALANRTDPRLGSVETMLFAPGASAPLAPAAT